MKFPQRRQFLHLAAGAAVLPAMSRIGWAQVYPSRPVRILVGFTAGSGPDIVARLIGQWLSERLGQQVLIENRPGGASNIATEAVVRSAPDGYTLLLVTSGNAVNASLYDRLSFNFIRDIAPVAAITRTPHVMEVHPSFPARTVPELITFAKAKPGKVTLASAGNGSPGHLAGALLRMMVGIDLTHVPYRGASQAVTDLIGAQVDVAIVTLAASIEQIRAGKLRPIAMTTETRLELLPDLPTVSEFVPGFEASGWLGIGAPSGTPSEVIARLNGEINAGLADGVLQARFADLGLTQIIASPADFATLIVAETDKWAKVVKFAGIKPD
ncbi:MAG: MFS transporter [Blastocatellia bacterium]|nr:MAG: MFS transporter [Blastocatellia bacterium]